MDRVGIALNRFGLGARPDEPAPADPERWLADQIARFEPRPAPLAALPPRSEIVEQLGDYLEEARAEGRRPPPPDPAMDEETAMPGDRLAGLPQSARQFLRRGIRDHYLAMAGARLALALSSPVPFAERLVHFWANHFAVSADKLPVIGLAGLLEFEAIRPNLSGRFFDMLLAVERHPAMLLYLDQAQSIGPNSRGGQMSRRFARQQRGLNENLAREILELHTLGVDGGYGQADVTELARAMTGWTVSGLARGRVARLLGRNGRAGDFAFADLIHEPGSRSVLGRRYDQPGEGQARAILADLASHPATARHLATKLSRHFAGDSAPEAMIKRLSGAYLASGGRLSAVYQAILDSPEAWALRPLKFKSPWDWSVSALRAVGATELRPELAGNLLNQLGQPTWRPGSPSGWEDSDSSWAGPEALIRRAEVAERIARQAPSSIDARALGDRILPGALSESTKRAIARAESPQQGVALLLVAPELVRR